MDIDIEIVDSVNKYRNSRLGLLAAIGAKGSNRDPFTELSEVIVSQRLDADRAKNRNQKGWDLQHSDGSKVEVKTVSNRADAFKNGIEIRFPPMSSKSHHHEVAVVMIVDFQPQMILVFNENSAEQCYKAPLNKSKLDVTKYTKFVLTPENLRDIWTTTLDLSQYSVNVIPLPWNTQT